MTAVIATNPKVQFFSSAGAPLANGTLTTYVSGSSTPATTWQDKDQNTANTNPIQLDSSGRCLLWLDPAVTYRFLLQNADGVTQWDVANITGATPGSFVASLAASGGSALIGFLQAGTGATARTVQAKLRDIVSVKDFGAVGDGVADDTTPIQAAINTGASVAFPKGIYACSGLTGSTNEQRLFALGAVRIKKNANGAILTHSGQDIELNGLLFDGVSATYTGRNVVLSGDHPRIINCGSRDADGLALWAYGNSVEIHGTNEIWQTATGSGYDIQIGTSGTNTLYHVLDGIYTSQSTGGIYLIDTGSHSLTNGQFGKLDIQSTGVAGNNGGKTIGNRITGAVNINSSNAVFTGNQFAAIAITIGGIDPTTGGVILDRTNNYQTGCTITNSGNGNNLIERNTSTGSFPTIQYGGDAGLGSESITANIGEWRWTGGNIALGTNNKNITARNAANNADHSVLLYDSSNNVHIGLGATGQGFYYGTTNVNMVVGGSTRMQGTSTAWRGNTDNSYSLGDGSSRWTEVFAVNGTINTSDQRHKQDIAAISDDVLDAWESVQWRQFRWKDAVSEKGDGARLHFGLIAQEVEQAFKAKGLDAFKLGVLCFDEWDDQWEDQPIPDGDGMTTQRVLKQAAGNRYGVRYSQAESIEAAYQRRRLDRIEALLKP